MQNAKCRMQNVKCRILNPEIRGKIPGKMIEIDRQKRKEKTA
jgi:hypothetical protein